MKILLYLVMFCLLLNGFATAKSLIQDSCKKAAVFPDLNYDLCVKSLEANPQSKTTKSVHVLVLVSSQNALSEATKVKGTIDKLLKERRFDKESEMPLRDCLQLYTDATDALNEVVATANTHYYKVAITDLNAAMGAPKTCELAFKESKKKSPVTKENKAFFQVVEIPLALIYLGFDPPRK